MILKLKAGGILNSAPQRACRELRKADLAALFGAVEHKGFGNFLPCRVQHTVFFGAGKILSCNGGKRGVIGIKNADDVTDPDIFVVSNV